MICSIALLAVSVLADPDYEKLLKDVKLSLTEAIDKGGREVAGGTPLTAYLEDVEGAPRWFVFVAKGKETVEVEIDAKEGKVLAKETLAEDDSKLVKAMKVGLAQAVKAAIGKGKGRAVYIDFDVDEKEAPQFEVEIFEEGELKVVHIDGKTGKVIK